MTSPKSFAATWSARLGAEDRRLMSKVAATHSPVLDHLFPRLSRMADNSKLWVGIAGLLAVSTHPRARRAALRGLGAVALASTTTNVVTKALFPRVRPDADLAPVIRRLRRPPVTTSFPSGHAASAAAFATGVALELPRVGVPVGALALGVAASRVVVGVHYPSDVVAGLAIGTGVGLATLRWWPRRPWRPAAAYPVREEAPACPRGEGVVLVMNPNSGGSSRALERYLRQELPELELVVLDDGADPIPVLRKAAETARVLGVAGGDGTVNAAATVALESDLPLFVVPGGTFNHFAQDLGLMGAADAVAALRAGDAVGVDAAMAGDQVFLNTASTGAYVDMVRARASLEERVGKWPAVLLALVRTIRAGRPQTLVINGRPTRVWLLFIGNCRYEPQGFAPSHRTALDDGVLDIRAISAGPPLARLRLVAAVALGTLARSRVYRAWTASGIDIRPGQAMELSLDGEVSGPVPEVRVRKRRAALLVYRPA